MTTLTESQKTMRHMTLALVCVMLALLIFSAILPFLFSANDEKPTSVPGIAFADPSSSADITADEAYMGLDRTVYYKTVSAYEITVPIHEANVSSQDAEVQLLYRLLMAAIAGDENAYNACFSAEYIEKSGRFSSFTQQKLYDITIAQYDQSNVQIPTGYESVCVFGLTYKIKDNNGSLRNDVASDRTKEQLIYVVSDVNNNAFVYAVQTYS